MKNIIEICKDLGFEIPAEKEADFLKAVAGSYKTIEEHNKAITKIELERDAEKERADTAEDTLKTFEGIDPAKIQEELNTWKQKVENAEKDYADKIYQRDFEDALKTALAEYEFSSEAAKKSISAEVVGAGLKLKDGKILGFSDLMAQLKEADESAFISKEQSQNKAKFTTKMNPAGSATYKSAAEINAIKDATERQRAIGENLHLYGITKGD